MRHSPPPDWGQGVATVPLTPVDILRAAIPRRSLSKAVNRFRRRNFFRLLNAFFKLVALRTTERLVGGKVSITPALYLRVFRGDTGEVEDLGLASMRVVTTAGVGFLVDAWQNLVEMENMRFHAYGTGVAAEATSDTALGTEETTQYNPDNTRPTGTIVEGASANIFRSVGTYTPDSGGTRAITEHGLMSQAATGGGVLWDRSVFSVVNLNSANGDSLETTYEATLPAGG